MLFRSLQIEVLTEKNAAMERLCGVDRDKLYVVACACIRSTPTITGVSLCFYFENKETKNISFSAVSYLSN